jgi:hypothetical protein
LIDSPVAAALGFAPLDLPRERYQPPGTSLVGRVLAREKAEHVALFSVDPTLVRVRQGRHGEPRVIGQQRNHPVDVTVLERSVFAAADVSMTAART